MPYMRKRRYLSFVRRTKAVIAKSVASSFLLIHRVSRELSLVDKQWVYEGHIIAMNGLPKAATPTLQTPNDLQKIAQRVGDNAGLTYQPDKWVITGWSATTVIRNLGDTEYPSPIKLDAYYWRTNRDTSRDFTNQAGFTYPGYPGGVWTAALENLMSSHPTGGSVLQISDLGLTPFQGPTFAAHFTIYKKTTTTVDIGKSVTFEQRSSKDIYFNAQKYSEVGCIRGVSEGIFFVFRGSPGNGAGGVMVKALPASMGCATTINYTYRYIANGTSFGGETAV